MFKHITGILLVLGSLLLGCVYFWFNEDEASKPADEEKTYWNPIEEVPKFGDLFLKEGVKPSLEKQSKTFLLIVEDSLSNSSETKESFMFLAEYDPLTNGLKMNSIADYDRQSVSNTTSNEANLKTQLEKQYDMDIDHTVTVDMDGLKSVIDELVPEGIEVTISEAMIEKYQLDQEPGTYTLYGKDLLNADPDFNRVLLQPEVMASIKDSIMSKLQGFDGMLKIPGLLKEVQASVQTDMDFNDLVSMVSTIAIKGVDDLNELSLPVTVESDTPIDEEEQSSEAVFIQTPVYKSNYPAGL